MEAYSFQIGGPLSITVRNVGPSSVDLKNADYFINGVSATSTGCAMTLTPVGSCQVSLALGSYASLLSGAAYPVKVVTSDGGVFSFSVVFGASS